MKNHIHFYSGIIMRILFFIIAFVPMLNAQDNPVKFSLGEYNFKAIYDTSNYSSSLRINKKGNIIYTADFIGRITSIKADNLNKDGQTDIFIENYSGGAHCCFSLYVGYIINDNFIISDSLNLGNSDYEIKDLKDDNIREITAYNDIFAYAFTNFAQSRFTPLVYTLEKNKFVNVTGNFPNVVNASIKELETELKTYTDAGFKCMKDGEETFNTDAGAVKAILAPIVANYHILGNAEKGYDLVNSVYKCPDRDKFKEILKNDYKLK